MTLDLSGLSGVTLYEPEELVLSARAGTPLAEIEALVASKNQQLEFEPMDYGPLLGQPDGAGSLGGALAANLGIGIAKWRARKTMSTAVRPCWPAAPSPKSRSCVWSGM